MQKGAQQLEIIEKLAKLEKSLLKLYDNVPW